MGYSPGMLASACAHMCLVFRILLCALIELFDTWDTSLKIEVECVGKCRRRVFCWDIPGGVASRDVDVG